MKKYAASSLNLFRQIGNDYMLAVLFLVPIVTGFLLKFFVPYVLRIVSNYTEVPDYIVLLLDMLYLLITPWMFCFAFALIFLEEIDNQLARYFMVTPLGKKGYLFSRVGIPAIAALVFTPIFLGIFHSSGLNWIHVLLLSIFSALLGMILVLIIVAFSANKLEGMAVTKIASLTLLGILPPFLLQGDRQCFFFLLPAYWLGKYVVESRLSALITGVLLALLWILFLARRILSRLAQ
ncbi:ABC transporter permease [Enterococcus florum]|uniref:ABC transporter permease n=1 Tax=Enterococcus florum TaxID=2480627 RepID=A0A4P5P9H2_9ENTE|nr:hypothetical protein [Enterococcus florum]GCF92122.1 ABC transporter permease [Enterococcus florum]